MVHDNGSMIQYVTTALHNHFSSYLIYIVQQCEIVQKMGVTLVSGKL